MGEKISRITEKTERYVVDGKEYHKLSDVPAASRKLIEAHLNRTLEDKDKDGIPDILQRTNSVSSYVVSREVYTSSDKPSQQAADLMKSAFRDLKDESSGGKLPFNEQSHQVIDSPLISRQKDRFSGKLALYIAVILVVMLAVFYFG